MVGISSPMERLPEMHTVGISSPIGRREPQTVGISSPIGRREPIAYESAWNGLAAEALLLLAGEDGAEVAVEVEGCTVEL
jgi:hypothetical protein